MTEIENRNPDPLTKNIVLMTAVDDIINATRANSVWPLTFGLACCAIEMMATGAAKYDLDRFGSGPFRGTPRQSDLMVVAGTVTHKMAPRVKRLYDQMPEPKWVISMGACASCGGVFDTYTLVQGVDQFMPVDIYVPGCPPRPEDLIDAVMQIQKLIGDETVSVARMTKREEISQGTLG